MFFVSNGRVVKQPIPGLPQVFEYWQSGTSVQLRIKGYVPSRKYHYMSSMLKGKAQGVPGPAGAVSS